MKISYNWLNSYIDLSEYTLNEISDILTGTGLEVEGIEKHEQVKGNLEGLLIGEVISCSKHPDADKLSVTKVDIGRSELLDIVCGAPNVAAGQKVVVAPVGSTIYPINQDPFTLKKAKIRGQVSEGMIVAEDEVGLGTSHDGIMVLETHLPNGTPAAKHFNLESDHILEIGLTPNRADAASHLGVARDLKAVLKKPLQLYNVDAFNIDNNNLNIPVEVENIEACPRYSAITISGVKVEPSPEWLQNKLQAIGLTPINNIVDITNFILHDLGQPLHAFDADKITGKKVVVKTLPQDTTFKTLDEKDRKLQAEDLMICDAEVGMCIAGVFGGINSGVTENTKDVFLESAYFSPTYIRRTAQHHALKTDASFRFERGTNPEITVYALKKAALMIREIAGGKISSEIVDIYPRPVKPFEVEMNYRQIDRLIGKKIDRAEIRRILQDLDIEARNESEEKFLAIVPTYRVDVTRQADVIEEILRIYGYDNVEFPRHLSAGFLSEFPEKDPDHLQYQVSQLLISSGYNEIITNSLTNPKYSHQLESFDAGNDVQILNKLSEELGVMRQSLLFTGIEIVVYNINHRQKDLKLFEFGKVYWRQSNGNYQEKYKLGIFISGDIEAENWRNTSRPADFHDLTSIVNKIIGRFTPQLPDQSYFENDMFDYGLELNIGNANIAQVGRISSKASQLAELKQPLFYAELDWGQLIRLSKSEYTYTEVSKFPEVRRDLSLVIDKSITFDQIKQLAHKHESRLIRNINIFDYYEGENIGSDKKAYALSFILQEKDKTLTDKIIDKVMTRLMQSFEKELGANIRK
ncbi:MAG: phenylalanine--tRNA ligase subunit beta [Cyclobacteriaceae bacterium]